MSCSVLLSFGSVEDRSPNVVASSMVPSLESVNAVVTSMVSCCDSVEVGSVDTVLREGLSLYIIYKACVGSFLFLLFDLVFLESHALVYVVTVIP